MSGLGVIEVDATSGTSPWDAPGNWDSIKIGGVVYGTNAPDSTTLAQEANGITTVPVINSFLPVGGKVRIRGAERYYKIDTKDAAGSDGWTQTYRGVRPKPFYIEFYIWSALQYDQFVNFVIPAITYNGTKGNVQPLIVEHPMLDAIGIGAIFVHSIGAIEPVNEHMPDMYKCVVTVAEYLRPPPTNTTATPSGPKAANQSTTPGLVPMTASEKRLKIIEQLNKRADSLGLPAPFGSP